MAIISFLRLYCNLLPEGFRRKKEEECLFDLFQFKEN